jgi:hypothetical protein
MSRPRTLPSKPPRVALVSTTSSVVEDDRELARQAVGLLRALRHSVGQDPYIGFVLDHPQEETTATVVEEESAWLDAVCLPAGLLDPSVDALGDM